MVLIPPPSVIALASNSTSLLLEINIGSKDPPDPFPPVTLIDNTSSISNSWLSIKISSTVPVTTGWTNAVVPSPVETSMNGGLTTSKEDPPFKSSTLSRGP